MPDDEKWGMDLRTKFRAICPSRIKNFCGMDLQVRTGQDGHLPAGPAGFGDDEVDFMLYPS
jgi:hypothetical protein